MYIEMQEKCQKLHVINVQETAKWRFQGFKPPRRAKKRADSEFFSLSSLPASLASTVL